MADPSGYCYATTEFIVADPRLKPWFGDVDASGFAVPGSEPPGPWHGQTAVCIASGPSLTQQDCERVRGLRVLTSNDSWRLAPFADVFCAADRAWWMAHIDKLPAGPERWTGSLNAAREFDLEFFPNHKPGVSTGAMAIQIAAYLGARRIILLGYDCSIDDGVHWHGRHETTTNPDAEVVTGWVTQFEKTADDMRARGVDVTNCSRKTALTCFPRASLEETLASARSSQYNTANAVSGDRHE